MVELIFVLIFALANIVVGFALGVFFVLRVFKNSDGVFKLSVLKELIKNKCSKKGGDPS